jgi:hypothetical protein
MQVFMRGHIIKVVHGMPEVQRGQQNSAST